MNEFTARKMGEVLAFAEVGSETIEKGKSGLSVAYGEATVNAMLEISRNQAAQLIELAAGVNISEAVMKKAEATGVKLRKMRELYLKEEDWNDPAELLEWSGFFLGAAVVHWGLVQGAAEALEWEDLKKAAATARALYENFLDQSTEAIRKIAQEKSKE
jgi:hypothetical protein